MKIKMILISLVAHCSQLLGQDITKEHWASCLQITKEDKTYSGLTISSLSLYEFKTIIRFKGETEGWHRFGVGVSGGFNDGSQTVLLIKLGEDGLWAKKAEQDEAELVCPFPLAVGQKWMRGEQTCCLSGIRDFEGEEGTNEDCLVFEIENKQGGETVKSEIWYAPEVGQIFSRTGDDKYSRTLRRTR